MVKDMTVGNPTKLILSFSLPLLVGNIFQQLYNMVDALIVGRFVGVKSLAAVGSTGSLAFLVLGFIIGLTSGFSVLAAQRFGAKDEDGLRHSVAMSIYLCAAFTIIITLLSVLTSKSLLLLMKTPADILDDANTYIIIIYMGCIVAFIYNMLAGILRALGDSRTPLYFLIIASILNVILDIAFVVNFNMGVAGAAYATVISQGVSGLLCFIYIKKKFPILKFQKKDWKFNSNTAKHLLKIGLPMSFQFSITAIGVMILQSAINSFGSTVVAAFTAASKVEPLATMPLASLGVTMATYTGQNLGAGKYERIKDGVKKCMIISLIASLIGSALVFLFGRYFVNLFLSEPQEEVINYATKYLNTIALFFFPLGILFIFRNTLQGLGDGLIPLLGGVIELVSRSVIALVFSGIFGYAAVCYASPLSWITAAPWLYICYRIRAKKLIDSET
ncbi:MATE family efflux transporter [Mobilisporobacter senegalensis]|nr:MATE family efflux transporter [Mobilisporobacter senegalensis]